LSLPIQPVAIATLYQIPALHFQADHIQGSRMQLEQTLIQRAAIHQIHSGQAHTLQWDQVFVNL
jgi:hypothetical protein